MKKINLLIPILGVATLSSSLVPLVSCGNSQFTVKFDTQGGSTIADVKVNKNGKVAKPADPTKPGFNFGGWYTDSACTNAFDFDTPITANITLYAKWVSGITEEQWHKAFEQIKDPYNKNRDFTVEGSIISYDETVEPEVQNFVAKSKGTTIDGTHIYEGGQQTDKYYSIITNDCVIWSLSYDNDKQPILESILTNIPSTFFVVLGGLFDSWYEDATKIKDHVYRVDVLDQEYVKAYCDFTFDEQNRIKTIDAKMVSVGSTEEVLKEAIANFKDYGSTVVDTATITTEYNKAKISDHIKEATLSTDKYVASATEGGFNQINFIMPETLSLSNLNTIKVTSGSYLLDETIFLNGNLLVQDTDYEVTETVGEEKYPKTIKLKNPLKASDKLIVTGQASKTSERLALELSQAA